MSDIVLTMNAFQGLIGCLMQLVVALLLLGVYAFLAWQSSSKANHYTQTHQAISDLKADLFNYSLTLIAVVVAILLPFTVWNKWQDELYFIHLGYYSLFTLITGYELYVSAANGFESLRKTSEVSITSR